MPCGESATILKKFATKTRVALCRSDWAFEHSGLNFDQRLGSQSTFTAQNVRIFSRTPDELRFPSKFYCFYCICFTHGISHTVHL